MTPLASFTVGLLAENTEQNLNFGVGLWLLVTILLIPAASMLITRSQMTFCTRLAAIDVLAVIPVLRHNTGYVTCTVPHRHLEFFFIVIKII